MSEAYIEPSPVATRDQAEIEAVLAEEQQLTDNTEQAVEALLLALVLQGGATPSEPLAPTVLRSAIEPLMKPLLLSLGLIMLRRSRRRGSTEDWDALSARVINDAVVQMSMTLAGGALRVAGPGDLYKRDGTGPKDLPAWAKQVSHTLVTSITEGFKAGLANRLGFNYKQWVTREDTKVRDTHRWLHNTIVHRNDPFVTQSNAQLDHPGDRTAPIGEWINCRCDIVWLRGRHT